MKHYVISVGGKYVGTAKTVISFIFESNANFFVEFNKNKDILSCPSLSRGFRDRMRAGGKRRR